MVVLDLEEDCPNFSKINLIVVPGRSGDSLNLRISLLEYRNRIIDKDPYDEQNVEDRAAASETTSKFCSVGIVDPLEEISWEDIYE